MTVKQNQPTLYTALDTLPWAATPIAARHIDTGHGRVTTRTIQTLPAPADLPFPHVNQVWLIERYVTDTAGTSRSAVAALGVTSLTTTRATPENIATYVSEHWGIESLHWLRDTVYREDDSGRPHPLRPPSHGRPEKPRHRRIPPARTPRHHRSHPLGHPCHGPAIQDPQPHIMILERP